MHTCPRRFDGQENLDSWQNSGKTRYCSYCGSLHPDDAILRIADGAPVDPTDKRYKVYIGNDKLYFQHFELMHKEEFIRLYNDRETGAGMNVSEPGYFNPLPFFMSYSKGA